MLGRKVEKGAMDAGQRCSTVTCYGTEGLGEEDKDCEECESTETKEKPENCMPTKVLGYYSTEDWTNALT